MKLTDFRHRFGTDEACREHLESVRWPDGPVCPGCGTVNKAAPVGGRPGLYRCHACGRQFTVTVGTAMEGTHLPLRVWYLAMFLMLSTAKPISAMSLSKHLGIQYRTCWHLLHRLRAMLAAAERLPLAGIVEADETYVGGEARNLQKHRVRPTRGRGTSKPMPLRPCRAWWRGAHGRDPVRRRRRDRPAALPLARPRRRVLHR